MSSNSMIMHPVTVSTITDEKLSWKPVSYLSRLNEEAKTIDTEAIHRVRVSVIGFKMPSSAADAVKDCVRIYDAKANKSRPADAKSVLKGKNECYVFSLPAYVKDFSNLHSNETNVMHIVDSGTNKDSCFFPGITPQDLLKNKAAQNSAMQALSLLQKFNVWLEATVSVNPDGHMIVTDQTKLKAY